MIFFVALTAVIAVLSAAQDVNDKTCPGYGLMYCNDLLDTKYVLQVEDTPLEENGEILDKKCEKTKPFVKCVLAFGANCPNSSENVYYQGLVNGYAVLSRVCDKNDLRKTYLDNAKCINEHDAETDKKCRTSEFSGSGTLTKEQCAAQKRLFACTFEEVNKNCGNEALILLKELVSSVTKFYDKFCNDV